MSKSIFIYLLILVILDVWCETSTCLAMDSDNNFATPADFTKGYECDKEDQIAKIILNVKCFKGVNCNAQTVPDGCKCEKNW